MNNGFITSSPLWWGFLFIQKCTIVTKQKKEKYSDAVEKFQKIKNDNLNSDELSYYTEIQVRVTKKLADIQ